MAPQTLHPLKIPRTINILLLAATLPILGGSACGAEWSGSLDSNFQKAENWHEANVNDAQPPNARTGNGTRLSVVNGLDAPLHYTEQEGETSFVEQLLLGAQDGPSGELQITGGSLTVQQTFPAIIGQTVEGKITVAGGSLNLIGGGNDNEMEGIFWSLFLGNEENGKGTLAISGGDVSVEGGLLIGRKSSEGLLLITGTGRFTSGGPTAFFEGWNAKRIILGEGGGVFEQTSDGDIRFSQGDTTGWISFTKGSHAKISLHGKDKAHFEKLVLEGRIRMDDLTATPAHFVFTKNGDQGEYQLSTK